MLGEEVYRALSLTPGEAGGYKVGSHFRMRKHASLVAYLYPRRGAFFFKPVPYQVYYTVVAGCRETTQHTYIQQGHSLARRLTN